MTPEFPPTVRTAMVVISGVYERRNGRMPDDLYRTALDLAADEAGGTEGLLEGLALIALTLAARVAEAEGSTDDEVLTGIYAEAPLYPFPTGRPRLKVLAGGKVDSTDTPDGAA